MVGCSLKQTLYLQGEIWMIRWPLWAFSVYLHMTNWRTDAIICATLLEKVWHRAILSTDTRPWHSEKWVRMLCISSHLSVQGYNSSSANISWRGFFRWENKLFSPGGLPTEEAMTRSAKAITSATNFVAMFNFSTSVPKFTPVATILFCGVRYVPDGVRQKLSWKRQPYLFWFGLIPAKWKQAAILPR